MIHALLSVILLASPAFSQEKPAPKAQPAAKAHGAQGAPKAPGTETGQPKPPAQPPGPPPTEMVTPAPEEAPKPAPAPEAPEGYGKTRGVAGPVTFGPSISLLGFPHPLEAALQVKALSWFGAQFTYGFIPKFTVSGISVKMNATDFRLRVFPFRGSFYMGAALLGKQKVTVSKTQTITNGPATADVLAVGELKSDFITPQIGWRWEWHSGIFLGLDLGWQINRNANTTITTSSADPGFAAVQSSADYTKLVDDIKSKGNEYGNKGLPSFTLLQLGFMF